jgi:hypothetical protein
LVDPCLTNNFITDVHIAMTENMDNLVLTILKDIQTRLGRVEDRLTSMELRMIAQEQHLGTLVTSLPASHDRIDALTRRIEHIRTAT